MSYEKEEDERSDVNWDRFAVRGCRLGVRCRLSVNPTSWYFPPSHLGNSSKLDCARFGVGCPLSVVRCPLSVVGCPLSVVGCRLSVVRCPLSVVRCRLSVVGCPLSVVLI